MPNNLLVFSSVEIQEMLSKLRNYHTHIQTALLFVLSTVLIVYMFPRSGSFKYEFQKGKPWMHETLMAPYDFPILKSEEELQKEQQLIKENHKPTLLYDATVFELQAEDFINEFEDKWSKDKEVKKDLKFTFFNLFKQRSIKSNSKKATLANYGLQILEDLYEDGIVQLTDELELQDEDFEVLLTQNNVAEIVSLGDMYTIESAANYIYAIDKWSEEEEAFLSPLLLSSLQQNVYFDANTSAKMLEQELYNLSKARGMVQKGQVIVSQGELVTDEKYQALVSFRKEYEGQHWSESSHSWLFFGQSLLVFVALLIFYLFLKQFRADILADNSKVTLLLSMIVLMVLAATLIVAISSKHIYLIPFCLLPIILKAFFDTRLALFTHLIAIIIIGFIVPNGFEFVYLQLMAGIVSILSVLQMYKRAQLFISAAKITAIYFVAYFAMALTQEGSMDNIQWMNFVWFAANGALTLFAYPMIFAFEKTFSLVSDVSLLELSDTNNPLLRELAQKAPGTFQHSLQVANLAEEGILEIGGNALLIRAGALYHDIGKMKNPQFFIENQSTGINPHDELAFEESAEVIIEHVKNGIAIAKENNLPDELIDFIRTHHGTSMVQYFYKQYVASFPEEIEATDKFTYPGPKPFSKETAVLMMADSVEAAARSLKEPTAENIDRLVEGIINKQIDEEQFVNADITLKSITQIKKLYKKKLQSIHHLRVEY
jgi:putative nucleotidyltransferase with HDIG domain